MCDSVHLSLCLSTKLLKLHISILCNISYLFVNGCYGGHACNSQNAQEMAPFIDGSDITKPITDCGKTLKYRKDIGKTDYRSISIPNMKLPPPFFIMTIGAKWRALCQGLKKVSILFSTFYHICQVSYTPTGKPV